MSVHQLHSTDREAFLTKRQTADLLGFSVRWLDQKVADERLPAHMIGGQRRFLWSEVVQWVKTRENGTPR